MHTDNKTISSFIDIPIINDGVNDAFTITNWHLNESVYSNLSTYYSILVADNENDDNLFIIPKQANAGIFSTTSAFKTVTYKENTS